MNDANVLPNLRSYDIILVNTSAGKDSQAMMTEVVKLAEAHGVKDRVVAVHCDLGNVEWEGTRELAERQAAHYGIKLYVEKRGMWPDSKARYCTSEFKRAPVYKLLTKLVREHQAANGKAQVRILNCIGIRAQESSGRAKKNPFQHDLKASNGKRHVDTWFPIFTWSVDQVWDCIRRSGVEHHRAYDLGMPRLSCCFCVMAPRSALLLAAEHNQNLLDQYVAVEQRIGHKFTAKLAIADVKAAYDAGERTQGLNVIASWAC
jgi:3'-phosphoadenosine 5'-phosphosulfate sulfotransferase (PAPS reductase)/FAD synthetase